MVTDSQPTSRPKPSPRRRAALPIADCPMAAAVAIIGDRWSLLILREAFYGVVRHADIRDDLGIPRSVLSDRLSKLVEQGLLTKSEYREEGARPRQAYKLAPKGRGMVLTFIALTQWGSEHCLDGDSPVEVIDKETGGQLRLSLINENDAPVAASRAALQVHDPGD
ncbi:MAG: winged helix-turn-helix transcriptional regulator [Devosiaceae bacterium]